MHNNSVKRNYALSLINTILGVAFPLITFPYITRVIAPEDIGQVQFFTTIIDYIILFTSLGIPLYAVREIAKIRDSSEKRNQLTVDLLALHLICTVIGYSFVFLLCFILPQIQENVPLFLLLSFGIILNTIGVQWYFQAIEDFEYITIRSFIVKIVCLALLFTFVRTKEDLLNYGLVQLLGTGGNYLFNFFRLKKYIGRWGKYIKQICLLKHLKPSLRVFLLNISVGIYTQISFLLLGFLVGNEAVGFYSMPFRITSVSLSIITALGSVLLPRFSNYVGCNKEEEFKTLGNKSISFILAIALPMSAGLLILARPITLLVCGELYIPSISVLRILSPIILIIGISQIYGKYMLYSLGKELLLVKCTFVGLLIFIAVGIPAIHFYSERGASIATICAEMGVTLCMVFTGSKYLKCSLFRKENLSYVISTIIMSIFVIISLFIDSPVISLFTGLALGIFSYMICLILFNDPFYNELVSLYKHKIRKE